MADALLIRRIQHQQRRRRVPRYLKIRGNPMELSDREFCRRFRLDRETFLFLCDILQDKIELSPIGYPVELQVLSTLRFLGSGSFQTVIGDDHFLQLSQATISRNVNRVCSGIFQLMKNFINFPRTAEEKLKIKMEFFERCGIPNVVGVIDGTHILIEKPYTQDWFSYINRKGKFSINVQIVCDAKANILDIVARWPGSTHDAHIWSLCGLRQIFQAEDTGNSRMTNQSSFLLGDSGYPLEPWLIKPYSEERNQEQIFFNRKFRSSRSTIERCNGILKLRFRCLHETGGCLVYAPDKVCKIIISAAVLHNICIQRNAPLPEDDDDLADDDLADEGDNPTDSTVVQSTNSNLLNRAKLIRDSLAAHMFAAA